MEYTVKVRVCCYIRTKSHELNVIVM